MNFFERIFDRITEIIYPDYEKQREQIHASASYQNHGKTSRAIVDGALELNRKLIEFNEKLDEAEEGPDYLKHLIEEGRRVAKKKNGDVPNSYAETELARTAFRQGVRQHF